MPRLVFCTLLILTLAGCRQSAQPASNPAVNIDLHAAALAVGATELTVTLTGADGQPLTARKIAIAGDMTHPGMAPEFAEATDGENGVYRVPFAWSMRGDWIVTVTVTLPDGSTAEKRFDMSIEN